MVDSPLTDRSNVSPNGSLPQNIEYYEHDKLLLSNE